MPSPSAAPPPLASDTRSGLLSIQSQNIGGDKFFKGLVGLSQVATTSLPAATVGNKAALVYDSTTNTIKYSDGTAWKNTGGTSQWTDVTGGIEYTSGNVHIGSATTSLLTKLHVVHDPGVSGGAGPYLSLQNPRGASGAHVGIDFWTYGVGDKPGARIVSVDDGSYGSSIKFQTKVPGAPNNALIDRWVIQNNGHINIDSGTLYVNTDTHRVGVGTTNPYAGTMVISAAGGAGIGADLWLHNSSGSIASGGARIAFSPDGTTDTVPGATIEAWVSGSSFRTGLLFTTYNGSASAERMRLRYDGNFGIGDADPATKLAVNGQAKFYGAGAPLLIDSNDTSGNTLSMYINASAGSNGVPGIEFQRQGTMVGQLLGFTSENFGMVDGMNVAAPTGKNIGFRTNGNTLALKMDTNGRVKVGGGGTIARSFEVTGSVVDTSVGVTNTNVSGWTGVLFNNSSNVYKFALAYGNASVANVNQRDLAFINLQSTDFAFLKTDTTELARFKSSTGNFGIGDNNPAEKLTVVGKVKITGAGNGVVFPDGTTQTTAATGGTAGSITANTEILKKDTFVPELTCNSATYVTVLSGTYNQASPGGNIVVRASSMLFPISSGTVARFRVVYDGMPSDERNITLNGTSLHNQVDFDFIVPGASTSGSKTIELQVSAPSGGTLTFNSADSASILLTQPVSPATTGLAGITPADSFVLHEWKLDEAAGSTVFHNTGSAGDTASTQLTYTPGGVDIVGRTGPFGRAVRFYGNNSQVLTGAGTVNPNASLLAIEAWYRPDQGGFGGGSIQIAGKGFGATWTAPFISFGIGTNSTSFGDVVGTITIGSSFYSVGTNAKNNRLVLGQLNHIAFSWDGTTARLYLNGDEVEAWTSPNIPAGAVNLTNTNYYIGGRHSKDGEPTYGTVNMVRVHSGTIRNAAYWRNQYLAVRGWPA